MASRKSSAKKRAASRPRAKTIKGPADRVLDSAAAEYPTDPVTGRLYYGDNLEVLRRHILDESVDLVYLDPPFNSNRSYNVLFRGKTGKESQAQIQAFDDTWTWSQESQVQYEEIV